MKTSLALIVLLILNTSALLSEPLAQLVRGIDFWMLITIEMVLLLILYLHLQLKGLNAINQIDFKDINLFGVISKDETSQES